MKNKNIIIAVLLLIAAWLFLGRKKTGASGGGLVSGTANGSTPGAATGAGRSGSPFSGLGASYPSSGGSSGSGFNLGNILSGLKSFFSGSTSSRNATVAQALDTGLPAEYGSLSGAPAGTWTDGQSSFNNYADAFSSTGFSIFGNGFDYTPSGQNNYAWNGDFGGGLNYGNAATDSAGFYTPDFSSTDFSTSTAYDYTFGDASSTGSGYYDTIDFSGGGWGGDW